MLAHSDINYISGPPNLENIESPLTVAYRLAIEKNIHVSDELWFNYVFEAGPRMPFEIAWILTHAKMALDDIYSLISDDEFDSKPEIFLNIYKNGKRKLTKETDKKALISVTINTRDQSTSAARKISQQAVLKKIRKTLPFFVEPELSQLQKDITNKIIKR